MPLQTRRAKFKPRRPYRRISKLNGRDPILPAERTPVFILIADSNDGLLHCAAPWLLGKLSTLSVTRRYERIYSNAALASRFACIGFLHRARAQKPITARRYIRNTPMCLGSERRSGSSLLGTVEQVQRSSWASSDS